MDEPILTDRDFEKVSRLIYEKCGIYLHEGKRELVKARLGKRLRAGNFPSFTHYLKYVTTEEGTDELIMIDSLSTNLTYFFREEKHFQKLAELLTVMERKLVKKREIPKILLWSAGCSSGEEPYSMAIVAKETIKDSGIPIKILATDISTRVLKTAMTGIYPEERIRTVPALLLKKYFQIGIGKWRGHYRVKREIREMVKFKRFNLMEEIPSSVFFDVIFCRNVMIYFDKQTQEGLVNRFYHSLKREGYLFVGHSESLTGLTHPFKYVGPGVYVK